MRRGVALALTAAAALSACGGGSTTGSSGDTLEVFGPWRGVEADRFAEVLSAFEGETGIDVRYVGSADFVVDLQRRTGESSNPPDVAIVPQPGLIRQLAADGRIVALGDEAGAAVEENFGGDLAPFATVDGVRYGVPYRITIKSLVWYPPTLFAERGWTIPESLDELEGLVDRIAASGDIAPWCLGIESGTATGWVATDWIEDLVLRSIGPDGYQRWVRGEIDYADPEITAAFERFTAIALERGRSFGGLRGVLQTPVSEAAEPLLGPDPGCAMHRQSSVAANWFGDDTSIGPDGDLDFFVLPSSTAGSPPPLVLAGEHAVQFRAAPDIDRLMAYLAGPEAAIIWAKRGGFLSVNAQVPDSAYPRDYLRQLADAFDGASAVVFDASDQLPPAVGSGLLWELTTEWIAGTVDYDTLASTIDEALDGATGVVSAPN